MVRILHTADVHLTPEHGERRSALESLLSRAAAEDVDLVTIGGDLFDSELAAERLRDALRELFSDRPFPVLAIPGNHDADAFGNDLFFGEDFLAGTETPFDHVVLGDGDARVTFLPYTPRATDELLVALRDRDPFDGPEFLLLHCSLEAPVRGGVGDEGARRYFPVTKRELAELDFEYYLAGHYHANHLAELGGGGTFVYPGSPASVTRGETGRRTVALVDTDAGRGVRLRHLDSFHYDELECRVLPGEEDDVLETIRSRVETWDGRAVEPEIAVDGYTRMDERAFAEALAEASGDVPVDNDARTVEHVLSHPLFEAFQARLEEREDLAAVDGADDSDAEAFRAAVREEVLAVFAELRAEGTLA